VWISRLAPTPFYREALARGRQGTIGRLAFVESYYHADRLSAKPPLDNTPESRLRNWMFDKALSGDIIMEQNIRTLDVVNWVMDAVPLHASGTCGRKVRLDVGDCNDYFTLHFLIPAAWG